MSSLHRVNRRIRSLCNWDRGRGRPQIAVSCPVLPAGLAGGCEAPQGAALASGGSCAKSNIRGGEGRGLGQTSLNVAVRLGRSEGCSPGTRSPFKPPLGRRWPSAGWGEPSSLSAAHRNGGEGRREGPGVLTEPRALGKGDETPNAGAEAGGEGAAPGPVWEVLRGRSPAGRTRRRLRLRRDPGLSNKGKLSPNFAARSGEGSGRAGGLPAAPSGRPPHPAGGGGGAVPGSAPRFPAHPPPSRSAPRASSLLRASRPLRRSRRLVFSTSPPPPRFLPTSPGRGGGARAGERNASVLAAVTTSRCGRAARGLFARLREEKRLGLLGVPAVASAEGARCARG